MFGSLGLDLLAESFALSALYLVVYKVCPWMRGATFTLRDRKFQGCVALCPVLVSVSIVVKRHREHGDSYKATLLQFHRFGPLSSWQRAR